MTPETLNPDDFFQCRQCGECCTGYGGTYLSPGDIRHISAFVGTDPDTFVRDCCQMSGGRPVLRVDDRGKCLFFDTVRQCTIHPVKPRMCRAWPFIAPILKAPGNWDIMAQACPGIRTDVSREQLKACVIQELARLDRDRDGIDDGSPGDSQHQRGEG